MRKPSFLADSEIFCLLISVHLCGGIAPAYPVGANNWHLNSPLQMQANADLVCKVHVIAVRDVGLVPSKLSLGGPKVMRKVAIAQVVSVLAGGCPDSIDIEFDSPLNDGALLGFPVRRLFTELRPGEDCLLFLQRTEHGESDYRLPRIRSKARAVAVPVPHDLVDEPLLRLLDEFRTGLSADDKQVRLQAAEELGYVGDALMEQLGPFPGGDDPDRSQQIALGLRQGRDAIQRGRGDSNFVIRSVAIISSFRLGDPPSLDQAMELLRTDPNRFTSAESEIEYGIDSFSVSGLQKRLLETMDATTRRAIKSLHDGATIRRTGARPGIYRGVPGFPYAEFFRMALETAPVVRDPEMRRAVANVLWIRCEPASIPEMIHLLDDEEPHIRQTAVSSLNKCVHGNFSNAWDWRTFYGLGRTVGGSGQTAEKPLEQRLADYNENEKEYLAYWKDWWRENRDRFETGNTQEAVTPLSVGMEPNGTD